MRNAIEQQKGLKSEYDEDSLELAFISINIDTTFGLTKEDWCHGSLQARGNRRVLGKMTGEGFPICYLLSRTETGAGAASMFIDTRDFLRKYENRFLFYWNLVITDHHDGVISEVKKITQGTMTILIDLNPYPSS